MKIYKTEYEDQLDFIQKGNRCGTPDPSPAILNRIERNRSRVRGSNALIEDVMQKINIPVRFIHILIGSVGTVSESQRSLQIEVLNNAFAPAGISFSYDENDVVQVDNSSWFEAAPQTVEELEMKHEVIQSPADQLNFITSSAGGLLGWATFPWELALQPQMDGVVVLFDSLPGGNAAPYNLGHTGTHEIAHWLGLLHTFQGGCNPIGDNIPDTVAHAEPNYETPDPTRRNGACDPNQRAPVNNFMNYVDDSHMTEFSELQHSRMREMIGIFRPNLIENGASNELRSRFRRIDPAQ